MRLRHSAPPNPRTKEMMMPHQQQEAALQSPPHRSMLSSLRIPHPPCGAPCKAMTKQNHPWTVRAARRCRMRWRRS